MSTTKDDLQSFQAFVIEQIEADSGLELPQLFDLWMLQNPKQDDYAENVAAVNASIADFLNGERGTPAGQNSMELRKEFGLSNE